MILHGIDYITSIKHYIKYENQVHSKDLLNEENETRLFRVNVTIGYLIVIATKLTNYFNLDLDLKV